MMKLEPIKAGFRELNYQMLRSLKDEGKLQDDTLANIARDRNNVLVSAKEMSAYLKLSKIAGDGQFMDMATYRLLMERTNPGGEPEKS
jgi:uncharacterized protein YehS (DUF1456 family)